MAYRVLAVDYDGTIATEGVVAAATEKALERWRDSGRLVVLVTGRQLDDLSRVFPGAAGLFTWIVAENGPVLFRPETRETRLLAARPAPDFCDLMVLPNGVSKGTGLSAALRAMAVDPLEVAGIGDGENDAAMIGICGLGVAVANAVPDLKAAASKVTDGEAGAGVVELIDELLASEPLPDCSS